MKENATLRRLLTDELRDIYHAEQQLVKTLPKLVKASTSPDLREALDNHLGETEEQVARLEQAFDLLGETAKTKACAGMRGIVEEGSELIKDLEKGMALDAGIIAGAQRAEHYEIAVYGTLMSWAKALGHDDVAELLSATLEEEKAADEKLSELAEAGINEAAKSGTDDEEEEEEGADEEEEEASTSSSDRRKQPQMAGSRSGTDRPRSAGKSRSGDNRGR
jgi:ferritin-like metal-binding protein YciE